MKKIVVKLATWVFLAGLLFSGVGIWKIIEEWNVSSTPEEMAIDKVSDPQDQLIYASIHGGRVDFANTYEYSLTTKKKDVALTTDFYTPVVNTDTGKVVYILKLPSEPTITQLAEEASYTGLLSNLKNLPEKLQDAFRAEFPGQRYYFLDSTYESKSLMEKLTDLRIFLILLFGGLAIRIIFSEKSPPQPAVEEASDDTNS
jgi:hypothetical protein